MGAGLAGTAEGVENRDPNPVAEGGDVPVGKPEAVGTAAHAIAAVGDMVEEPAVAATMERELEAEEAEQDGPLEGTTAALSSLSSIYQRSPW